MKRLIEMNKGNALIAALLGVVIGICAALVYFRATDDRKFDGDYSRWRKLNLILQQIEENYVDTIDVEAMTDAAVEAALHELDPHSVYLPPVELKESETELAGNFEGIGIQFNVPNDTAIVLSVISGGPSEKAGLLQGDRILKVDDSQLPSAWISLGDLVGEGLLLCAGTSTGAAAVGTVFGHRLPPFSAWGIYPL